MTERSPMIWLYGIDGETPLGKQFNACMAWAMNRSGNRSQPKIADRREERSQLLFHRRQGEVLFGALRRGDVVVMHSPEVVFRSATDCLRTMEMAYQRGVKLAFCRNKFDLTTEEGRADLHRAILRDRGRFIVRAARNLERRSPPPLGYEYSKITGDLMPDNPERAIAALIRVLIRTYELSYEEVSKLFEKCSVIHRLRELHAAMLLQWPVVPKSMLKEMVFNSRDFPIVKQANAKKPTKPAKKCTKESVRKVLRTGFWTAYEIAEKLGVHHSRVRYTLTKQSVWKWVMRDISGSRVKYSWVSSGRAAPQPPYAQLPKPMASASLFQPVPDRDAADPQPVPRLGQEPGQVTAEGDPLCSRSQSGPRTPSSSPS